MSEFILVVHLSYVITNPTYGRKISVDVDEAKMSSTNPWFYPGKAPLYSQCGMAGGSPKNYDGIPGNDAYPPSGVAWGSFFFSFLILNRIEYTPNDQVKKEKGQENSLS